MTFRQRNKHRPTPSTDKAGNPVPLTDLQKILREQAAEKITVTSNGTHKTIDKSEALGKVYRSLSALARSITGTRWSGPRFFGLG